MSNGQKLYERYAALTLEHNNCMMDQWEELAEDDRRAWELLGDEVAAHEGVPS
jgi:hypothetical protein